MQIVDSKDLICHARAIESFKCGFWLARRLETEREPITIIYQTAEDGLNDTIKLRLIEADADCKMVKVIDKSETPLTMLDERLEQAIAETGFNFIGKHDISAEDLLLGTCKDNKTQTAENLLNEMLEDGKKPQSDIMNRAKAEGISKRTLDEVKKNMYIKSLKENNKWYWELIKA